MAELARCPSRPSAPPQRSLDVGPKSHTHHSNNSNHTISTSHVMPEIKLIEAPQLLVDWNRLGGEDRKCEMRGLRHRGTLYFETNS